MDKNGKHILRRPIEHGILTDYNCIKEIWNQIFNRLKVESSEHPVLIADNPFGPKANREKITTSMFEEFNVPSLYMAPHAVLTMIAAGKTTGIVLV